MSDNEYIFSVDESNFVAVVAENSKLVPVFLDFYADWCAPCQTLMPILNKLANEYQGKFILAKINSDEQQTLASKFGVRSLPTVKIIRHEQTIDEFTGVLTESNLRELIEKYIDHEWDIVHQNAIQLIRNGKMDAAISQLKKAYQLAPHITNIKIDLTTVLFQTGEIEQANKIINTFTASEKLSPEVKSLLARINYHTIAEKSPKPEQLQQQINQHPNDAELHFQLSVQYILTGKYEAAMEQLLEVIKLEKNSDQQRGREAMINVFEMLGNSGERVKYFRNKMSSLLY